MLIPNQVQLTFKIGQNKNLLKDTPPNLYGALLM